MWATSHNAVSGQDVSHAGSGGGAEQRCGRDDGAEDAHLAEGEDLDDGPHEEAGEVDHAVQGAHYHRGARRGHAQVMQEVAEQ